MASYNKIILLGNLTRDPQLSYTPSQTAVVDFGLATNRSWKGQDGSQRDETCFVDCRMFGKRAEVINKYMRKGQPLFVEGRLTFDSWTAQDGTKRSRHRVTVEEFQFVGGSQGNQGGGSQQPSNQQQSGGYNAAPAPAAAPQQQNQAPSGPAYGDAIDDIPF